MRQPTRSTQLYIALGQYISSNSCNYMVLEVETIKLQTRAAYGCMAAGQSPRAWACAESKAVRWLCLCYTALLLQYAVGGAV